jgi:hypothetical protein
MGTASPHIATTTTTMMTMRTRDACAVRAVR